MVKPSGEEMEEWMCFNTFGQTFFTLFVLSTGEHWNAIMHEVMDSPDGPGELIAVGFFLSFQFLCVAAPAPRPRPRPRPRPPRAAASDAARAVG